MKFDYVIGNPPYQESRDTTKDIPVYHDFIDAAYTVADKVELITPARFLFNAGATPKPWNKKMLDDEHFKVLHYEPDSSQTFVSTDIKGGIAIHYHDKSKKFGAIKTFIVYEELNTIREKVQLSEDFKDISDMVYSESAWRISNIFHEECPNESDKLGKSASSFFASNVFDVLSSDVFKIDPPNDDDYICLYGRSKGKRVYRYIKSKYISAPDNCNRYKVFIPKSNGTGTFGETLSTPIIGEPFIGHTQTFISIGNFTTKLEAESALKYIKSKFARTCLGMLKITQDNKKETWKCVPSQDFTENSDIDWTKSIHEIDQQLYKKYHLSQKEIDFIETHVKEMV